MKRNWIEHKPKEFKWKNNNRHIDNWFSNMIEAKIEIDHIIWPSTENYYQAMKFEDEAIQEEIRKVTPYKAKSLARKYKKQIRKDWDDVKVTCMHDALYAKFTQHAKWREKLMNTSDEVLVEWNNWRDKFWGADYKTGEGENMLGELLMHLRKGLQKNTNKSFITEVKLIKIYPGGPSELGLILHRGEKINTHFYHPEHLDRLTFGITEAIVLTYPEYWQPIKWKLT